MIHPRLATMLVVITTDYPLDRRRGRGVPAPGGRTELQPDLRRRRLLDERRGGPARERCERCGPGRRGVREALDEVCSDLARQVVADGEGATVVLEIGVTGAASPAEAEAIARRIATSPLVKTAAFGHDPNWGRVLMAAGSAPYGDGFARLETDRLTVALRRRRRIRRGIADRHRAGALGRGLQDRSASSASVTAPPAIWRQISRTTTCASTRSTRREPDRPQARRARRGGRQRRGAGLAGRRARRRRRPRSRAADHGRDGAARDRARLRRRDGG